MKFDMPVSAQLLLGLALASSVAPISARAVLRRESQDVDAERKLNIEYSSRQLDSACNTDDVRVEIPTCSMKSRSVLKCDGGKWKVEQECSADTSCMYRIAEVQSVTQSDVSSKVSWDL